MAELDPNQSFVLSITQTVIHFIIKTSIQYCTQAKCSKVVEEQRDDLHKTIWTVVSVAYFPAQCPAGKAAVRTGEISVNISRREKSFTSSIIRW